MPIQTSDQIIGPSRGTAAGWSKAVSSLPGIVNRDEVNQWIRQVYQINAPDDMPDAAIVVAQAFVETGNFTNKWWRERKNAGSLGVTGAPAQDAISPTFNTTLSSARAMSAHDLLYATGQINRGGLTPADDPRFAAYREAYGTNSFPKLSQLATRYAADPEYAKTIAARAAQLYSGDLTGGGGDPVAQPIVFGRVPYPKMIESQLSTNNPWVKSGAPAVPEAVVWHRMIGTFVGTDSWFHSGNAATAYGVSVKVTDGVGGKIYEWLSRSSGLYGESSGPVDEPYGDGLALVNKVGAGNVNKTTKAIEISGNYETPLDADAKHAVAAITAYWADQKKIPWDQFPIIPGENRSFVVWHQEITIGSGKECPGAVVMNATPEMIQMTADIMKQYQVDTTVPPPTPDVPKYAKPGWTPPQDGKDHTDAKGTLWRAVDRVVRVKGGTKFYAQASLASKATRLPAPDGGIDVRIAWTFNSWYCTPAGSRFKVAQSNIKVSFKDQEV